MPVVIWGPHNKFRIIINVRDHDPPHVHILFGKGTGVCEIRATITDCTVLTIRGKVLRSDLQKVLDLVEDQQEFLLEKWEEYHEQN